MSKTKIDSKKLIEQIKLRDRVVRVISKDGKFRVAAIKNTKSAKTAQINHELPHIPAFLLARALSAASMMSSFLKGEERITLAFEGNGLISYLYAEALQIGELRGYVNYTPDLHKTEINSISELLGDGLMKVIRIVYDNDEPITSVINLQKGDIATDLAYYFVQSEQIPTAIILDVDFDDEGMIKQSGGILLQALPGTTEDDLKLVYEKLTGLESLCKYLDAGLTPDKMLKEILPFEFDLTGSTPVDFFCRCSKQGFLNKLLTLHPEEIRDMKKHHHNELVCQYCNKKYYLDENDFSALITDTTAKQN